MKHRLIVFLFSLFSFQQILAQDGFPEQVSVNAQGPMGATGFYVNEGQTQINSLDCYTFKDLYAALNLKASYFDGVYWRVQIGLYKEGDRWYFRQWTWDLDRNEFLSYFRNKDYLAFAVFDNPDLKAKSGLGRANRSSSQNFYLTRASLQHSHAKKYLEGMHLKVELMVGEVSGYRKEYSTDVHGNVVEQRIPHYSHVIVASSKLPLNNRIKKGMMEATPPKNPVSTGDCYGGK